MNNHETLGQIFANQEWHKLPWNIPELRRKINAYVNWYFGAMNVDYFLNYGSPDVPLVKQFLSQIGQMAFIAGNWDNMEKIDAAAIGAANGSESKLVTKKTDMCNLVGKLNNSDVISRIFSDFPNFDGKFNIIADTETFQFLDTKTQLEYLDMFKSILRPDGVIIVAGHDFLDGGVPKSHYTGKEIFPINNIEKQAKELGKYVKKEPLLAGCTKKRAKDIIKDLGDIGLTIEHSELIEYHVYEKPISQLGNNAKASKQAKCSDNGSADFDDKMPEYHNYHHKRRLRIYTLSPLVRWVHGT